jgi:tetratricopeptide (TPR) repeat protein
VPASVVDLSQVGQWCPACFVDGKPVARVAGLDTYLALLARAYAASPADVARARELARGGRRLIDGSAYLGAIVPESADLHNTLGIGLAQQGHLDEAIAEFRAALALDPQSAATHWHLGAALASRGARAEAIDHLRRSVQLDPANQLVQDDLRALTRVEERSEDRSLPTSRRQR